MLGNTAVDVRINLRVATVAAPNILSEKKSLIKTKLKCSKRKRLKPSSMDM